MQEFFTVPGWGHVKFHKAVFWGKVALGDFPWFAANQSCWKLTEKQIGEAWNWAGVQIYPKLNGKNIHKNVSPLVSAEQSNNVSEQDVHGQ